MYGVGTPGLLFYSHSLHSVILQGILRDNARDPAVDTMPRIISPPGNQVPQSFPLRFMKDSRDMISQKLGPEWKWPGCHTCPRLKERTWGRPTKEDWKKIQMLSYTIRDKDWKDSNKTKEPCTGGAVNLQNKKERSVWHGKGGSQPVSLHRSPPVRVIAGEVSYTKRARHWFRSPRGLQPHGVLPRCSGSWLEAFDCHLHFIQFELSGYKKNIF